MVFTSYVPRCRWKRSTSDSDYKVIAARESNTYWPCRPTCRMCPSVPTYGYLHPRVHQAAKGVNTSFDGLVDLLESIEHVLKPLNIYTQIPPTPAMDEILLKIVVELLSTLALTTKEITQGRPSEFVFADVLRFSLERRDIRKEDFRRKGCRGDLTKAGPTLGR